MTVFELFKQDDGFLNKYTVLISEDADDIALIRPYIHRSDRLMKLFPSWMMGEVLSIGQQEEDPRNPVWYIKVKKCKMMLDNGKEV